MMETSAMPQRFPEPPTDRLPMMGVLLSLFVLMIVIICIWLLAPAGWAEITDWIAPTTRLTLEDGVKLMERL